ncbi:MAG: sulfurtransferase TusA family protein [Hydrogenovibrio sp.]|uniref:sulfurtransferase TusA family protein n=1 Tax=Hydrogenovibrio TaxID=28884 RepID=UPI0003662CF3|nr:MULTISPECIES: sulfurtransferase TusA family protein [Hydrogenovibrio]MDR9498955.1 sulfurtransferase TusA family protein [Hydrogenovibrio sp.]
MKTIDVCDLPCPMPLLKLKQALAEGPEVTQFELYSTDPGSLRDLPAFCEQQGLGCESPSREDGRPFRFVVTRPD